MKKISYFLLLFLILTSLSGCKDSFAWQDRVPQGYQSIKNIKNHRTHPLTKKTKETTQNLTQAFSQTESAYTGRS